MIGNFNNDVNGNVKIDDSKDDDVIDKRLS